MCLGVPGQIIEITDTDPITRSGRVNFGGIVKEINLAYVPEAVVGNYVVVHVGFAISTVDEDEAALVFDYLAQMGELEELTAADSFADSVDVPTRGAP
ncbi:MAG: HypC/HybG/HupF family hydrogenase formation chaperone [Caldilineaceae bacterium]|nr:HypC/HybG/HupF family hydrogenase formation chaperone [Caldilineaceae bacterium]